MKTWAIPYLQCLGCHEELKSKSFHGVENDEIYEGVLTCSNRNCSCWYPIFRGIPRLLPESLRLAITHAFINTYEKELKELGLNIRIDASSEDNLHDLKQHTIENFGFEWVKYDRFGWDDTVYNLEHEKTVFQHKSLLTEEELADKVVLDAGCGNGRYSFFAAEKGANVIAVDLGDAVESAYKNTTELPNVQVIQGDIFNLPIRNGSMDTIYSIGVLMHTGNAKNAAMSLFTKLRQGGRITVHLYGKGNIFYEFADRIIRNRTTKMSIEKLQAFTDRMYRFRRILEKFRLAEIVNLFVKIDPHPTCIFDWYAAPIATHHTYKEVEQWFSEKRLKVLKTNKNIIVLGPRIKTKTKWKLSLIRIIKRLVYPLENIPVTVHGMKIGDDTQQDCL